MGGAKIPPQSTPEAHRLVISMTWVERGRFDQLPLGADAFEGHDQLQLEEDDRVDGGAAPLGVQLPGLLSDEAEIELFLQEPVEVGLGNEVLERDGDGLVEAAGLGGTEHNALPDVAHGGNRAESTARHRVARRLRVTTPRRHRPRLATSTQGETISVLTPMRHPLQFVPTSIQQSPDAQHAGAGRRFSERKEAVHGD